MLNAIEPHLHQDRALYDIPFRKQRNLLDCDLLALLQIQSTLLGCFTKNVIITMLSISSEISFFLVFKIDLPPCQTMKKILCFFMHCRYQEMQNS